MENGFSLSQNLQQLVGQCLRRPGFLFGPSLFAGEVPPRELHDAADEPGSEDKQDDGEGQGEGHNHGEGIAKGHAGDLRDLVDHQLIDKLVSCDECQPAGYGKTEEDGRYVEHEQDANYPSHPWLIVVRGTGGSKQSARRKRGRHGSTWSLKVFFSYGANVVIILFFQSFSCLLADLGEA
jgi:hypothetical protein